VDHLARSTQYVDIVCRKNRGITRVHIVLHAASGRQINKMKKEGIQRCVFDDKDKRTSSARPNVTVAIPERLIRKKGLSCHHQSRSKNNAA